MIQWRWRGPWMSLRMTLAYSKQVWATSQPIWGGVVRD